MDSERKNGTSWKRKLFNVNMSRFSMLHMFFFVLAISVLFFLFLSKSTTSISVDMEGWTSRPQLHQGDLIDVLAWDSAHGRILVVEGVAVDSSIESSNDHLEICFQSSVWQKICIWRWRDSQITASYSIGKRE